MSEVAAAAGLLVTSRVPAADEPDVAFLLQDLDDPEDDNGVKTIHGVLVGTVYSTLGWVLSLLSVWWLLL